MHHFHIGALRPADGANVAKRTGGTTDPGDSHATFWLPLDAVVGILIFFVVLAVTFAAVG